MRRFMGVFLSGLFSNMCFVHFFDEVKEIFQCLLTCSSRVLILVLIVFLLDTKSTQWEDPRVQINNKPSQVGTVDKHY